MGIQNILSSTDIIRVSNSSELTLITHILLSIKAS